MADKTYISKTGLSHFWANLKALLAGKQDKLTPGDNITIQDGVISSAGEKGDKGDKGDTGDTGVGIASVEQTTKSSESGGANVVTVTKTDGTKSTIQILNGNAVGTGIEVVQSTGTSTTDVMSQNAATEAFAKGLELRRHTALELTNTVSNNSPYFELDDRQAALLEARDVISIEFCGGIPNLNGNNYTTAPWYLKIILGDNVKLQTRYDGRFSYCGDMASAGLSWGGTEENHIWDGSKDTVINQIMSWYRWIAVIDRVNGRVGLYDKPGSLIAEHTSELFKGSSWLNGKNTVNLYAQKCQLWSLRIWDCDLSEIYGNNVHSNSEPLLADSLLPYSVPVWLSQTYSVDDFTDTLTKNRKPYGAASTMVFSFDDEGCHETAPTKGMYFVGLHYPSNNEYKNFSIVTQTLRVVSGSVVVSSHTATYQTLMRLYSCTGSDGTAYEDGSTLGEGTYTLIFLPGLYCRIAVAAEDNTEVVVGNPSYQIPRCVFSVDPRVCWNNSIYDPIAGLWYPAKSRETQNMSATVVDTEYKFGDVEMFGVPCPPTKASPSYNGEIKVDSSGNGYVGYVSGATKVWKKINNA